MYYRTLDGNEPIEKLLRQVKCLINLIEINTIVVYN